MATITDSALDFGRFALDYELESGTDYSDIVHNAPLKQSVNISIRDTSSKRINASKPLAKSGFEPKDSKDAHWAG
jgi:hypothetical protein